MFFAMVSCIMQIQSTFGIDCFITKVAIVCEWAGEMNTLHMIHYIVLLSICLSTEGALETGSSSNKVLCDILQEAVSVI
jgi:hypothetical protein